jgi:hypothetical protein
MRKSSIGQSFCCCYNAAVFTEKLLIGIVAILPALGWSQESKPQQKPEVKVHVLNVCSPSSEEQQEISAALAHVPKSPAFSEDFEVDRGRSVLDQSANPLGAVNPAAASPAEKTIADFVRVRRDITGSGTYSTVQYSFSRDSERMIETLVLRVRDPKDLLQLSIEDSASSVTSPTAMLAAATPPGRIKLERFGKSSIVLARCSGTADSPPADQSAYEPLFASASSILTGYRSLVNASSLVPEELNRIRRLGAAPKTAPSRKQGSAKHP